MNKTHFHSSWNLVKFFHPTCTSGKMPSGGHITPLLLLSCPFAPFAHVSSHVFGTAGTHITRSQAVTSPPASLALHGAHDIIREGCCMQFCMQFTLYGNTTQPQGFDPFPYIATVATVNLCNLEKVTSMPEKHIPEQCGKLLILKQSTSPFCVGKTPVNQT